MERGHWRRVLNRVYLNYQKRNAKEDAEFCFSLRGGGGQNEKKSACVICEWSLINLGQINKIKH